MNLEIWNNQKKFKTRQIRQAVKNAITLTLGNTEAGLLVQKMNIVPVFSVTFSDNKNIKQINSEYRKLDKETDVISFPSIDSNDKILSFIPENCVYIENGKRKINFGDIIISLEKAMEQSILYEQSFEREVFFLTIHSLLHLFGYNHINKKDELIMIKKQKEIMEIADLNILNKNGEPNK